MSSQNKKVSVIIPAYNSAEYIGEAVKSVLSQTYTNIEVVVIDDGSKDNIKEVLKPYLNDPRVEYFFQENKGLPEARNAGIEKVNGEYIKFLDADDFLMPEQIEKQVLDLELQKTDISATGYIRIYAGGEREDIKLDIDLVDPLASYIVHNRSCVHALLIRKSLMGKARFNPDLQSCEDYEYWMRLILNGGKISIIDEPLCCYRIVENSLSTNRDQMLKQKAKVVELLNKELLDRPDSLTFKVKRSLFLRNLKVLHQSLLMHWSVKEEFSHICKMQTKLYESKGKVLQKIIFKLLGLKYYSLLQLWMYRLRNKDYDYRLLNEEDIWRSVEGAKKRKAAFYKESS